MRRRLFSAPGLLGLFASVLYFGVIRETRADGELVFRLQIPRTDVPSDMFVPLTAPSDTVEVATSGGA